MNVRYLVFSFSVYLRQGPSCSYFIYKLVPDFQTFVTSRSLFQIQRNQHPLICFDPLYPDNQLKHVFESLKFEFQTV